MTKVYRTGAVEVQALRGVDLELPPGEMSVLLGPSGSGKSTLLNILGGLDSATSGRVWFHDLELTGLDDRGLTAYRRDHVGFVFQFYNLVPSPHRAGECGAGDRDRARPDASRPRPWSASAWAIGSSISRPSSPVASSSGWRSPARSPSGPTCCSATSRRARSTAPPACRCSRRSRQTNAELGTTTVVITHNAAIREIAHRVIHFADGRIARIDENASRRAPAEIAW